MSDKGEWEDFLKAVKPLAKNKQQAEQIQSMPKDNKVVETIKEQDLDEFLALLEQNSHKPVINVLNKLPDQINTLQNPKTELYINLLNKLFNFSSPRLKGKEMLSPPLALNDARRLNWRHAKKFKQGKLLIEARIDLHGKSLLEAEEALSSFIERCYQDSLTNLLVITGKGVNQERTIKANLVKWLNLPPLANYVLAVAEAKPEDGGGGAFYILLKRNLAN